MKPSPPKTIVRPKLRTFVSEAYWCNPKEKYAFERATIQIRKPQKDGVQPVQQNTAWLDELLDGGFVMPGTSCASNETKQSNALTVLLSGPPGTGKSTLAMELAYRWCTTSAWDEVIGVGRKPRILYLTNESRASWMINNAQSLGWDAPSSAEVFEESSDAREPIAYGKVRISAVQNLKKEAENLTGDDFLNAIKNIVGKPDRLDAEVLIVDSLNTVTTQEERFEIISTFYRWVSTGPRVIVIIADSPRADVSDVWEFASDVVIRLDKKYDDSGYMVRSIEVEKARYQKHVWGRHQLKIHEGSGFAEKCADANVQQQVASDRMRAHPYRRQGGVFIFPSIHYISSLYKRNAPTTQDLFISSCIPNLEKLLGSGYPRGRCTAMIGLRGGHKSHLGYEEILSRILPEYSSSKDQTFAERALVVSLRDDEGMTKQTMEKILARFGDKKAGKTLAELQQKGLLEITYYPPGYITPEEFFHRLLLSIKRLQQDAATSEPGKTPHVSLLFNSLEQLSSRFPLCAKEPIFIPGIIQMLTAEQVSSFFVTAVGGQAEETYGLETMAELILEFGRRTSSAEEFLDHVKKAYPNKEEQCKSVGELVKSDRQVVTLKVGRYAGGQAAGAEGILELVEKGKKHPLEGFGKTHDLIFMPSAGIRRKPSAVEELLEIAGGPTR